MHPNGHSKHEIGLKRSHRLKWNGGYHDEDGMALILMFFMVLRMEAVISYTGLCKIAKRAIYKAK